MEANITEKAQELLKVLLDEALGEKYKQRIGISGECINDVNFEQRRFFALSAIAELKKDSRYANRKEELAKLVQRTASASGCDEMFILLEEVLKVISEVKKNGLI